MLVHARTSPPLPATQEAAAAFGRSRHHAGASGGGSRLAVPGANLGCRRGHRRHASAVIPQRDAGTAAPALSARRPPEAFPPTSRVASSSRRSAPTTHHASRAARRRPCSAARRTGIRAARARSSCRVRSTEGADPVQPHLASRAPRRAAAFRRGARTRTLRRRRLRRARGAGFDGAPAPAATGGVGLGPGAGGADGLFPGTPPWTSATRERRAHAGERGLGYAILRARASQGGARGPVATESRTRRLFKPPSLGRHGNFSVQARRVQQPRAPTWAAATRSRRRRGQTAASIFGGGSARVGRARVAHPTGASLTAAGGPPAPCAARGAACHAPPGGTAATPQRRCLPTCATAAGRGERALARAAGDRLLHRRDSRSRARAWRRPLAAARARDGGGVGRPGELRGRPRTADSARVAPCRPPRPCAPPSGARHRRSPAPGHQRRERPPRGGGSRAPERASRRRGAGRATSSGRSSARCWILRARGRAATAARTSRTTRRTYEGTRATRTRTGTGPSAEGQGASSCGARPSAIAAAAAAAARARRAMRCRRRCRAPATARRRGAETAAAAAAATAARESPRPPPPRRARRRGGERLRQRWSRHSHGHHRLPTPVTAAPPPHAAPSGGRAPSPRRWRTGAGEFDSGAAAAGPAPSSSAAA